MKRLTLALALALTLTGCLPIAQFARDLADTSDGATLTYVLRTESAPPGLRFDPDGRAALGVIVTATGTNLTFISAPDASVCMLTATTLDCRLGDLTEPATVHFTGAGVLANASYRRADSSVPRLTFAR